MTHVENRYSFSLFFIDFRDQSLSLFGEGHGGRGSRQKMTKCNLGGGNSDLRSDVIFAWPLKT